MVKKKKQAPATAEKEKKEKNGPAKAASRKCVAALSKAEAAFKKAESALKKAEAALKRIQGKKRTKDTSSPDQVVTYDTTYTSNLVMDGVYVWNSLDGVIDDFGNPTPSIMRGSSNQFTLRDGDILFATIYDENGNATSYSAPFFITWIDMGGNTTDMAISSGYDTTDPNNPTTVNPTNPDTTIEADPNAFEDFSQYYDDNTSAGGDGGTPVYELSDCSTSIGIRG